MKKLLVLISLVALAPCQALAAAQFYQPVNISSSPSPVGSGARALGMGGAFIAVADDATAASWNPAGLVQLEEAELSFVGANHSWSGDFNSTSNPESNGPQKFISNNVNYFSAAMPVQLPWTNAVVSINYQGLYDLNKNLTFSTNMNGNETISIVLPPPFGTITKTLTWTSSQTTDFSQKGGLRALSPALAIQVTPFLSAGITLNWWTDALGLPNGWSSDLKVVATGSMNTAPAPTALSATTIAKDTFDSPSGVSANIGFLWEASEMIRLGVVWKTAAKVRMKHRHSEQQTVNGTSTSLTSNQNFDLHLPTSAGIGLGLRFSDAFSISADAYYTDWKNFYTQSSGGVRSSPIDGLPQSSSKVKSSTKVHLGSEYLWIKPGQVIPFRAGLFYDPQPSSNGNDKVWGATVGTGYMWKNTVFDIAYSYEWGKNMSGVGSSIPSSNYSMKRQHLYASCIMHL